MLTVYHCKCANNVNGMCYGNCSASYQMEVAHGSGIDPTKPVKETDCPGYIAPGQPMYSGTKQGDVTVHPFN